MIIKRNLKNISILTIIFFKTHRKTKLFFLIFRAPFGVLRLNLFRPARFLAQHGCGVSSLLRSLLAVAKKSGGASKGYHFARRREFSKGDFLDENNTYGKC